MRFIRSSADEGAAALAARLKGELAAGKRVLWLFSGGSNLPLAAQISRELPDDLTAQLTVLPADERYGLPGHKNSNVKQLLGAGFQRKNATLLPVLDGSDINLTTDHYETALQMALAESSACIAQIGMGADGHIAGILPHSPAVDGKDLVAAYTGPDYERITLTFVALARVTAAYLFAYGDAKRPALQDLRDKSLPLADQPAQFLKQLAEVYVYNDQLN